MRCGSQSHLILFYLTTYFFLSYYLLGDISLFDYDDALGIRICPFSINSEIFRWHAVGDIDIADTCSARLAPNGQTLYLPCASH